MILCPQTLIKTLKTRKARREFELLPRIIPYFANLSKVIQISTNIKLMIYFPKQKSIILLTDK